jgi:two-component system sensor histidine kinase AgrC
MKNIGNRLIGDPAHFTFDKRVFHLVILLGTAMSAASILINLYFRDSIVIDIIFFGCWIVCYYLSRFKGIFGTVSVVSLGILVFAFIPYSWISSAGSAGAVPYYSIVFIAVICIVLKGYLRLIMVLSTLLVLQLLILYDMGSVNAVFQASFLKISLPLVLMTAAMALLIILYSNTYMNERARSEAYAKTIGEQYKQQLYYMENLEELIYKLKSERHDFNNHLGVIYGLLENGETDKATAYGAQLIQAAEEYRNIVNIPYAMIRAMLNYKLSVAREEGIQLRLNITVPEGLPLNEFDLTVILGNLLDNAVEACKTVDGDKRYIRLGLTYKPDYLVLQMENPIKHDPVLKGGAFLTTKPNFDDHGFGLPNIVYLVSRHNGFMKIEPDDGVFRVNIALLAK